jgi:hypothetical protein
MKEQPMNHLSDELLSEQLDGQLDAATAARVSAHLADCAACAARFAGIQEVRAALQSLRQVDVIPDFRLTAQGVPRRVPTTITPHVRRPPAFIGALARGVSAAALLIGVVLLAVALFSGLSMLGGGHLAAIGASTAADQSVGSGCVNQPKCPNTDHPNPGSSTIAGTHPTTTPGATASSPTMPGTASTTGTSPGTTTSLSSTSNPLAVPVEAGLGLILAIGGTLGLRRFDKQTR